jgi:Tfp pilus assembly protein PilO
MEAALHSYPSEDYAEAAMYEPQDGTQHTTDTTHAANQATPEGAQSQTTFMGSSRAVIMTLAMALFAAVGYAAHESYNLRTIADQNAQAQEQLKSTNLQLEQLSAKLNELAAAKAAAPVQAVGSQPKAAHVRSHGQTHRASTRAAARARAAEEARLKKMQSQLDEQGNAIASTQQDLSSAKTELQGSIARTHGELVVLQRKGEHNYFEFDLDKSGQFHTQGPIGVRLRKSNVKHQYADLELLVDDVSLTKKHVNLYEPAMFYAADSEQPIQIVINSISKNHIHGYVSAPKYRRADLSAMAQSPAASDLTPAADGGARKSRERLSTPK